MRTPVIAHGDAAPVLEATEYDLDFMALFVEEFAVARLFPAAFAWRDAGRDASFLQRYPEPVGVVATVSNQICGVRQGRQQASGPSVIAHLPFRQQ